MPAEVQITAEQILREAKERELELVPPVSIHTKLFILFSSSSLAFSLSSPLSLYLSVSL